MDLNMGRLEVSEINKIVLEEEELLSCYRKLSTGLQQAFLDTFRWLSSGCNKEHTKTFATSGYTPQTNNNESEAGSKSPNS
tara:strand:- start:12017 stop:12259 length:243 start_codon:yes stop_codon:yes gene_type:complete